MCSPATIPACLEAYLDAARYAGDAPDPPVAAMLACAHAIAALACAVAAIDQTLLVRMPHA